VAAKKKSEEARSEDKPEAGRYQRPPAEILHAEELEKLRARTMGRKPPGWQLSLRAARTFLLGDDRARHPREARLAPVARGSLPRHARDDAAA
jgi:hypothetical protein